MRSLSAQRKNFQEETQEIVAVIAGKRIQFFSYGVNPKLFPVAFFLDPILAGICGALFEIRNQAEGKPGDEIRIEGFAHR